MAVNIVKLKRQAVEAGMDRADAKSATREALEKYLKRNSNSTKKKPAAKKATAVAKKKVTAKKKDATSAPADKKSTTASKSGKGKAKRPNTASSNGDVGRALINVRGLDFKNYDTNAWKPRANSAVSVLFRALRKNKGNVDKAFEELKADVWDFVGKKMRDGTKRPLKGGPQSGYGMLKYRLNRTLFEFATRTGQHSIATNRVKYGEGQYAKATKKTARKAQAATKKSETTKKAPTATKKRGRPKGSKNKKKS